MGIFDTITDTLAKSTGVNPLTVVETINADKVRIYRENKCLPGFGNIGVDYVDLGVGEYNELALASKELNLKDKVFGVRPGIGVKVELHNPPETPFIVTSNSQSCLPDNWGGQVKSFRITPVPIPATKEGFGNSMSMLVNILLLILILFIVYRIVMQMK